jgi:hypothetical protein
VVRASPRPEAETAVEKVRFEDSLQYARNRSLQQPVCDGGHSAGELHSYPTNIWDRVKSLTRFIRYVANSLSF